MCGEVECGWCEEFKAVVLRCGVERVTRGWMCGEVVGGYCGVEVEGQVLIRRP